MWAVSHMILSQCYSPQLSFCAGERLYWTEGYFDWIESSDLNGEDRKKVLSDPGAHLRSIFVDSQFIYYTGYNRQ